MLGVILDITQRKHREDEISRNRARFEAIFNSITDGVAFADPQRRIQAINPGFTRLFGYTEEEVVGRT